MITSCVDTYVAVSDEFSRVVAIILPIPFVYVFVLPPAVHIHEESLAPPLKTPFGAIKFDNVHRSLYLPLSAAPTHTNTHTHT